MLVVDNRLVFFATEVQGNCEIPMNWRIAAFPARWPSSQRSRPTRLPFIKVQLATGNCRNKWLKTGPRWSDGCGYGAGAGAQGNLAKSEQSSDEMSKQTATFFSVARLPLPWGVY